MEKNEWTLKDARDGDVVVSNQIILLFKKFQEESDCNFIIAHAGIDISGGLQITDGHWLISNSAKLATKEQCDLLFQKIKEAGYEWDAEKKELKRDEQNPVNIDYISGIRKMLLDIENNAENINGLTESHWVAIRAAHRLLGEYIVKEQKPAWSEEDEKMLQGTIDSLRRYQLSMPNFLVELQMRWLSSLKNRI